LNGRKRTWNPEGKPALASNIQNNQITLLQNGEAYFQALEGAPDLAVHDIYLESYIFENDGT
jgi:phosphatidylserine/phosphatidylglycerophosphate/cardiolipin synthase-like enzyme